MRCSYSYKNKISIVFLCAILLILISCEKNTPLEKQVLFDFESDAELDSFRWWCHSLMELSSQHVTHGNKSLKLALYPSPFPGLTPNIKKQDWSGYEAFCFDVYLNGDKNVNLTMKIDDQYQLRPNDDRYIVRLELEPGMNHIEIPLNKALITGTKRHLDIKNICGFVIFALNLEYKIELYFDFFRLIPSMKK